MEDAAYMDSLVGDYLASRSAQLAKKFKKETKANPLPPGSPNLVELVKEFNKTSPAKRKLSLSNGNTPAKKAKKVKAIFFRNFVLARARYVQKVCTCTLKKYVPVFFMLVYWGTVKNT